MRRLLPWVALVVVVGVVLMAGARPERRDPSPAARATRIAKELRCPVCQGLSVADSPSQTARAMVDDVKRRIEEGESDGEIRRAFVDRYGEWILLRPQGSGLSAFAWAIPIVALVLGAGGLALGFRRWRRIPSAPTTSWSRRVVVVVSLLGFAALVGFVLTRALGERLPGGTASGNTPGASEVTAQERIAAFEIGIKARPDDPLAHLNYARYLLGAGEEVDALREFDAVARLDPSNAEARAYGGWIVFLAGLVDEALVRIDSAIAADPTYADAHFFKGAVLYRGRGDARAAVPELQLYLAADPTGPLADEVRSLLVSAIEETGQAPFLDDSAETQSSVP